MTPLTSADAGILAPGSAVEGPLETFAEVGRQEGVDHGVHGRVCVGEGVACYAGVVEAVTTRQRPRVRPQPHHVTGGPAHREHGAHHHHQSGDLATYTPPLGTGSADGGGHLTLVHGPQLADHGSAQGTDDGNRK